MSDTVSLENHPLVFTVFADAVYLDLRARVVYLNEALSDVLSRSARVGLRPVVMTRPGATLTFAVRNIIELMDGRWLELQDDGTVVSPHTGRRWKFISDPLKPARWNAHVGTIPLTPPPVLVTSFSVSLQHAPTEELVLGGVAESLARHLANDEAGGWNTHEPALLRWDRSQITKYARDRMPTTSRLIVVGRAGRFQATMLARRTPNGVEESISGIARYSELGHERTEENTLAAITERARNALCAVAAEFTMPLVGMVSAGPGWPDLSQRRGSAIPAIPVALLVGPRATRQMGLNHEELAAGHRVEAVGRSRMPSTIVTFEPRPQGSWAELQEMVKMAGIDKVTEAAGVARPQEREADNV